MKRRLLRISGAILAVGLLAVAAGVHAAERVRRCAQRRGLLHPLRPLVAPESGPADGARELITDIDGAEIPFTRRCSRSKTTRRRRVDPGARSGRRRSHRRRCRQRTVLGIPEAGRRTDCSRNTATASSTTCRTSSWRVSWAHVRSGRPSKNRVHAWPGRRAGHDGSPRPFNKMSNNYVVSTRKSRGTSRSRSTAVRIIRSPGAQPARSSPETSLARPSNCTGAPCSTTLNAFSGMLKSGRTSTSSTTRPMVPSKCASTPRSACSRKSSTRSTRRARRSIMTTNNLMNPFLLDALEYKTAGELRRADRHQ